MERLQKVIADRGYCSRRKAEELIVQGKVYVDGNLVTTLGTKVSEKSQILIDGVFLKKEEKTYILFYKPRGVITSTKDEKNRKTVLDYIDINARIYPVGRLDYDTSGLLLLTNDGILANGLMHPRNEVEKVYIAKIKGFLDRDKVNALKNGVIIDGEKTAKSRVKVRKFDKKSQTSIVELIIHEGKNHQVKKMFEAVGCEVLKLKRERVAFLTLDHMKSGEYRHLTVKEVKKLYQVIS